MLKKIIMTLLILSIIPIYLAWLPTKLLINSLIPTDYVTTSIMNDIRSDLKAQPNLIAKVDKHTGPSKRYLHRTPLKIYTTVDLGMYDVYAMYINAGKEWVVRLGIFPDKNAETFFTNQIGGTTGQFIGWAIMMINKSIAVGLIKPMLYHVTDKPETSFVTSNYQSVPRLVK
jgi:hypothetical protein